MPAASASSSGRARISRPADRQPLQRPPVVRLAEPRARRLPDSGRRAAPRRSRRTAAPPPPPPPRSRGAVRRYKDPSHGITSCSRSVPPPGAAASGADPPTPLRESRRPRSERPLIADGRRGDTGCTWLAIAPDPEHAVDVILRDGLALRLRAPRKRDEQRLVSFFAHLSPESLHFRFHGFPSVDRALVEPIVEPDWAERGALVATTRLPRGERIVASATTCASAPAAARRGRVRGRGRLPRARPRDAHARAARRARARRTGSTSSSPTSSPATTRCAASSRTPASRSCSELEDGVFEARLRARPDRRGSRSGSRRATTSASATRSSRSSGRARSPSSAPRAGAGTDRRRALPQRPARRLRRAPSTR